MAVAWSKYTEEGGREGVLLIMLYSFGRMDALSRHRKAEHGVDLDVMKKAGTPPTHDIKASIDISPYDNNTNISKKRKLNQGQSDKHKRGKVMENGRHSGMRDSEDIDTFDMKTTLNAPTSHHQQRGSDAPPPSTSGLSSQHKYKIAKAKLQYILRENEMLNDEWTSLQRRLGRLQTERRVLLDALMTAEDNQDGDILSMDDEMDDDDNGLDEDEDDDDDDDDVEEDHDAIDDDQDEDEDMPPKKLDLPMEQPYSIVANHTHDSYVA